MMSVAIDGACRRNGKPDCLAAGGVFIFHHTNTNGKKTESFADYEMNSTNQRGELLALKRTLLCIREDPQQVQVITDSEYLFNSMTKSWVKSWMNKGWLTSAGDPVKNRDLWESIYKLSVDCDDAGAEVLYYHIKGHCMPFGKVTASQLLAKDNSAALLYNTMIKKYEEVTNTGSCLSNLGYARNLSKNNNGFVPDDEILKKFVVYNSVADAIATFCVEAADKMI